MLKLVDITKNYKVADSTVKALKGISLEFRKNEFVSILGQSGCGKTTLLNIIGGLDHYTSGDLIIRGKSTKQFTDADWDVYRNHRIGFIFQSYNLIPHQTVLQNVELALTISGISASQRKRKATEALRRVGLIAHLKKKPNQLSGGQMQRVAIARALVNDPEILLADEPTGALDTQTSVQIMNLIREIAGERLVIMVTHNPELAKEYSTRIVHLLDGKVVEDSNPYSGEEERQKLLEEIKKRGITDKQIQLYTQQKNKNAKKNEKANMSFATSLELSGKNLLSKKGRTAVTSIAGSIGIIGVCLVLALSSGFNNYITATEEDMLSAYPLTVAETSIDYETILEMMQSGKGSTLDPNRIKDKVYVNSLLSSMANGMSITNDITQEYINYVNNDMVNNYAYAVEYGYGLDIANNIYTSVDYKYNLPTEKGPELLFWDGEMSINAIAENYTAMLSYPEGNPLSRMLSMAGTPYGKLIDNKDYVLSQYDLIKGTYPGYDENGNKKDGNSASEMVLVLNEQNELTDIALAQLGIMSTEDFLALYTGTEENKVKSYPYDDILNKTYKYVKNDDAFFKDEEGWKYKGYSKEELTGINLNICGILRVKDGLNYGCLNSGIYFTQDLIDLILQDSKQSSIVNAIKISDNIDFVEENKCKNKILFTELRLKDTKYNSSKNISLRELGGNDLPNAIYIYAKDFDSKDKITSYLDAWNQDDSHAQIKYSDQVKLIMTIMQTMLNAVTYVLVAFTGISLVVSSVMIGVITYVSVVERTKEIGVLRSLGARKRDIRHLFNAETFIIGLLAGVFGVAVTYALSIVLNIVLLNLTSIAGLAALPWWQALVMVGISVVLTLISGLIPASAAAKKDPVIALRTE